MKTNIHFRRIVSAVVRDSGISRPTVEHVLPFIFDAIRRELTESERRGVQIESFGAFTVKELPARTYHYRRPSKGIDRWVEKPAKKILKFSPSRNMKREVEQGAFDPTRRSFYHHVDDPKMRFCDKYKKLSEHTEVYKGKMVTLKS